MIDMNPNTTAIIPVKKDRDKYILEVDKILWNQMQILILGGAIMKNVTIEFKIEEVQ